MIHNICKVSDFEFTGDYSLLVRFEDGSSQNIDFKDILYGELYSPLKDPAMFKQVSIDPIAKTLVWHNGADFDPATLHNWDRIKSSFLSKAQSWVSTKN